MASEDLPAVMNHIKKTTKQEQMYYVGHSQGTMIAFAEFSSDPNLAKSVKKFFALGPVSFLGNMKSPLKYLADLVPELKVGICFPKFVVCAVYIFFSNECPRVGYFHCSLY